MNLSLPPLPPTPLPSPLPPPLSPSLPHSLPPLPSPLQVTAEAAGMVVEEVFSVVDEAGEEDQNSNNIAVIASIFSSIDDLTRSGELVADVEVRIYIHMTQCIILS